MSNSFSLLGITIHLYSLCILLGILFAYFVIMHECKKKNINKDFVFNTMFYGIIIGILGARLYYVIFNLNYYINNITEIFKIWHGGLAIHGGIIFGIIFIYFYSKKYKYDFIELLDIFAPGLIIAQCFGRWGNFFNQEAYGFAVSKELLERLFVPRFIIDGMNINGLYYLPTFYFESIACLIGFVIMLFIRKKNNNIGVITSFYLIWYGIVRFIIEYFRTDSLMFGSLKQAQIISIISIIAGIIIFFKRKKRSKVV